MFLLLKWFVSCCVSSPSRVPCDGSEEVWLLLQTTLEISIPKREPTLPATLSGFTPGRLTDVNSSYSILI